MELFEETVWSDINENKCSVFHTGFDWFKDKVKKAREQLGTNSTRYSFRLIGQSEGSKTKKEQKKMSCRKMYTES